MKGQKAEVRTDTAATVRTASMVPTATVPVTARTESTAPNPWDTAPA